MSTSNTTLQPSSSENTGKAESAQKPTPKQLEELREKSLEDWRKRMIAGLNDQTKPFPRVW